MSDQSFPPMNERLSLKQTTGWFPAGDTFRKALAMLSDGAFKLFAYLCLEADWRTGRFQATHKELALAMGKSKRAIGSYIAELEARDICSVNPGKNQFAHTTFEISDSYWPYRRSDDCPESPEQKAYVESVRTCFLSLGCGSGKFGAAEESDARDLQRQGIPLAVIEEAMLMGACRKYGSWFEGNALEPIRSLTYFSPLIAEVQEKPFPPGYSEYLQNKVRQFAEAWKESVKSGNAAQGGGIPICLRRRSFNSEPLRGAEKVGFSMRQRNSVIFDEATGLRKSES